ncbi:hypothetical protein ECANGB1_2203 [Enterospora canceri]|uniref:Uncharacterized protein n=1 Tax=Enterospora canceri TaxID=1081671 RepID=A0A1Y1S607_9MICR|nr:hypothetical protein ECANGB1_2203 [Enterospora canceri]
MEHKKSRKRVTFDESADQKITLPAKNLDNYYWTDEDFETIDRFIEERETNNKNEETINDEKEEEKSPRIEETRNESKNEGLFDELDFIEPRDLLKIDMSEYQRGFDTKVEDSSIEMINKAANEIKREEEIEKKNIKNKVEEKSEQIDFMNAPEPKGGPSLLKMDEIRVNISKKTLERINGNIDLFRQDTIEFLDEPTLIEFRGVEYENRAEMERKTVGVSDYLENDPEREFRETTLPEVKRGESGLNLLKKTYSKTKKTIAGVVNKIGKVKGIVKQSNPYKENLLNTNGRNEDKTVQETNCYKFNENPFIRSDKMRK